MRRRESRNCGLVAWIRDRDRVVRVREKRRENEREKRKSAG